MDVTPPIRYRAFGGRGPLCQIDRVEEGFRANEAVEATPNSGCDLVFANDSGTHQEAIEYRDAVVPKAKLILGLLDVPEHLFSPPGDYTFEKIAALAARLRSADAITAISPFVQSQIIRYIGLPSYLTWMAVKTVSPAKRLAGERPYPYRVLLGGRLNDRNKRTDTLAIPALITAGFAESEVAVIGGEYPGWGTNLGIVDNATLNDLLNSVDFVMSTTLLGGLELGPAEGCICGAVPILTFDCSTFHDLPYPQHWGCYPSVPALAYRLRVLLNNPDILKADREHALYIGEGLAEDLSGAAVAKRILDVYRKLINSPFIP